MQKLSSLTFAQLRQANLTRLPQFKNKKGEPAHSQPDGSDWKLSAWSNALSGEAFEMSEQFFKAMAMVANLTKKTERDDFELGAILEDLGAEIADVVCYLDIFAYRAGLDLGGCVRSKFNRVSQKIDVNVLLTEDVEFFLDTVQLRDNAYCPCTTVASFNDDHMRIGVLGDYWVIVNMLTMMIVPYITKEAAQILALLSSSPTEYEPLKINLDITTAVSPVACPIINITV